MKAAGEAERYGVLESADGCGKELGLSVVEGFLRGGVARLSLVGRTVSKY